MMSFLYATAINFQDTATNDILAGSETTFGEWLARIFGGILGIAALLVLIYLVWGGISWITSAGDASKIQKARDQMTQAVIGLIVLMASTAIFMLVQSALGIEVLNITGGTTAQTTTGRNSTRSFWGRATATPD